MSDLALPQDGATRGAPRRRKTWLVYIVASAVAIAAFFAGRYFGYQSGYQAAYIPEHSHFIFEQRRAQAFQKRITDQRRCIDVHVRQIPTVDSGGFAGLGEMFRNVALLVATTRLCDGASGLGVPSQAEVKRIFPSSGS